MANFANRRAPNVSQYLANLNVIPSEHDQQQEQAYSVDNDLDMFTNAEFFNFDLTEGVNGTNNAVGEQVGNADQKTGYGNGNGSANRTRNPREGLDFPSGTLRMLRSGKIKIQMDQELSSWVPGLHEASKVLEIQAAPVLTCPSNRRISLRHYSHRPTWPTSRPCFRGSSDIILP